MSDLYGFADRKEYAFISYGGVCRICFASNRTGDTCSIHRYREKYGESFEVDTETDFNNNRRNDVANTDSGSEGSWNARHTLLVGSPFFPPYLICTISHHFH